MKINSADHCFTVVFDPVIVYSNVTQRFQNSIDIGREQS